ncbi:MAG: hypothetical protein ABEJ61_01085 [Haloferacaceae archaeon]
MGVVVTPTGEHPDRDARGLTVHPRNDVRTFPDGEVYVQIEGIDEVEEALAVHAGQPRPNRGPAYLLGALDDARSLLRAATGR